MLGVCVQRLELSSISAVVEIKMAFLRPIHAGQRIEK